MTWLILYFNYLLIIIPTEANEAIRQRPVKP
jgi:hypothetical protein